MNYKELYKEETSYDANGNIQLYAGDTQGIDIINEEYVDWLEKKLAMYHSLHLHGYIDIKLFEPKLFDMILIAGQEEYQIYIGDGQILTDKGEIIKFEQYEI